MNAVQLMTMGFTQAACEEAILQTGSLEEATEYLLSNPNAALQVCRSFPICVDGVFDYSKRHNRIEYCNNKIKASFNQF